MLRKPFLCATVALFLTGCSEFPELATPGSSDPATLTTPDILPLDKLLLAAESGVITEVTGQAVAARAARLRAKAAAMQGPVQDPATRARLAAAIAGRAKQ